MLNEPLKKLFEVTVINYFLFKVVCGLEIYTKRTSFSYNNSKNWGSDFPKCNGNNQSPINLDLNTPFNKTIKNFKFSGFDLKPMFMSLRNNGNTVVLKGWWPRGPPTISHGPLNDTYVFEQIQFHWGSSVEEGSGHTFNGKRYPLELNALFYKMEYHSMAEAMNHQDGLAIVAVLYDFALGSYSKIEPLRKYLFLVQPKNMAISLEPFAITQLGLAIHSEFLTYKGSLPYPPCLETVTWIISKNLEQVNLAEMNLFKQIELENYDALNYRSLQPINDRKVYTIVTWCPFPTCI